jgi:hypothetical protein
LIVQLRPVKLFIFRQSDQRNLRNPGNFESEQFLLGKEKNLTAVKTSSLLLIVLIVFTFPIWIGLAGGLFGLIFGLIGGLFGLFGAILGGIFGIIGSIFGGIFGWHNHWDGWGDHWHHHSHGGFWLVVIIIAFALALRSRAKQKTR